MFLRCSRASTRSPGLSQRALLRSRTCPARSQVCGEVFKDHGHKLVEKKMTKEELLATIGQYDGLVVRSGLKVTDEVMKHGTKLRIVGRVRRRRLPRPRPPSAAPRTPLPCLLPPSPG